MSTQENNLAFLPEKLRELESRIENLEHELSLAKQSVKALSEDELAGDDPAISMNGSAFESTFGEIGLAWLGNIVLLFGIIFFVQFLKSSGMSVLSSMLGYVSVAGLFLIARYMRSTHPNMSSIFRLNGYILLYLNTFFLHFLVNDPIITSRDLTIFFLLIITFLPTYMAIRRRSQGLTGLAFFMGIVTAIWSDSTHIMLPIAVVVAIAGVYFMHRFGWWRLLIFSIFIVYTVNLFWFLNNPIMGHPLKFLAEHEWGYLYLFAIAATYSITALLPQRGLFPDSSAISSLIVNGIGFSFLIMLYVISFFQENYVLLFGSIAIFCLIYSIILQYRSEWKVTASLYALYSFVALSVMVYGIYGFPRAYNLLALQSMLVVSMALWYRSRVIVLMNTALFVILLIAYFSSSATINSANISFALVALVTARIVNWKRERLNIKTEFIRNTYLFIGFIMVLFALFKIMPDQYVTVSWSIAAVAYFVLSITLKNIKYRYLALGTMAATAIYLFLIDLARVEILYRVITFLLLAVVSIVLSLYYTRRRAKKPEVTEE